MRGGKLDAFAGQPQSRLDEPRPRQPPVLAPEQAKPGGKTYGALSVGVQTVARVEKLFTIAPGAFRPPPKVRSGLIRLTPLAQPLVLDVEVAPLRTFVTACFSKRRKQLKNVVPEIDLEAMGFDPTVRPERLSPADFVRLFRHIGPPPLDPYP